MSGVFDDEKRFGILKCGWAVTQGHHLASPQSGRLVWSDDDDFTVFAETSDPNNFIICFYGLVRFDISFTAKVIRVSAADDATDDTIRHLLTDQILPRVIAHQGHHVLHAAAVVTPGGAIIIAGLTGCGKSTLAAALHAAGYPLLGDDAIIVEQEGGVFRCQAVYRSLRLFPDSLSSVFETFPELSQVAQYTHKLNVHLDAKEHLDLTFPVRAVLFLEPEKDGPISVERVSAANLCMKLVEHSFWMNPEDLEQARMRLQAASELATRVPAFNVSYRRNFSELVILRNAILEKVDQIC